MSGMPTGGAGAEASDALRRFVLRDASVRGEIVQLGPAWREIVRRHALPPSVRDHLGELSAAGLLLAATIKFEGALVLQIHGDGPVSLYVVEVDTDGHFRSTVKVRDGADPPADASLRALVDVHGRGRFVVTLDPRERTGAPYQGIVPFEGEGVAGALERYMDRSEQVPTRLWLAADGERAAGLLLQRLPDEGGAAGPRDADGWDRAQQLADTITPKELLELAPQELLHRLFWQERRDDLDERRWRFHCSCSHEKVAGMLRTLGRAEIESILVERGAIEVSCDYCNAPYRFDAVDATLLFADDGTVLPGSPSIN